MSGPASRFIGVITARDAETRNGSLDALCRTASLEELLAECEALDRFRRSSDNLYERVRALFFLYAIHRFHILTRARAALFADSIRRLCESPEAALRGGD